MLYFALPHKCLRVSRVAFSNRVNFRLRRVFVFAPSPRIAGLKMSVIVAVVLFAFVIGNDSFRPLRHRFCHSVGGGLLEPSGLVTENDSATWLYPDLPNRITPVT